MTALTQCVEGTLLFQKERDWKKHFDLVTIHKIMKTCNKITSSLSYALRACLDMGRVITCYLF